ncbi:MAG: hypothetical protein IPP36_09025 [Nitrosomonadales bacterium]|nr:hypothetical protein [Nitrosomonadales bacterium]
MDNSTKSFFSPELIFETDDKALNDRLGGTNTMYLLVEGAGDDAIKDPKILRAIGELQRFLENQPYVGKTLSLADFIMRMRSGYAWR